MVGFVIICWHPISDIVRFPIMQRGPQKMDRTAKSQREGKTSFRMRLRAVPGRFANERVSKSNLRETAKTLLSVSVAAAAVALLSSSMIMGEVPPTAMPPIIASAMYAAAPPYRRMNGRFPILVLRSNLLRFEMQVVQPTTVAFGNYCTFTILQRCVK